MWLPGTHRAQSSVASCINTQPPASTPSTSQSSVSIGSCSADTVTTTSGRQLTQGSQSRLTQLSVAQSACRAQASPSAASVGRLLLLELPAAAAGATTAVLLSRCARIRGVARPSGASSPSARMSSRQREPMSDLSRASSASTLPFSRDAVSS